MHLKTTTLRKPTRSRHLTFKPVSQPGYFWFNGKEWVPHYMGTKSYKFTTFKDLGNRCIQRVLFQSYNGSLESYDYILEKKWQCMEDSWSANHKIG